MKLLNFILAFSVLNLSAQEKLEDNTDYSKAVFVDLKDGPKIRSVGAVIKNWRELKSPSQYFPNPDGGSAVASAAATISTSGLLISILREKSKHSALKNRLTGAVIVTACADIGLNYYVSSQGRDPGLFPLRRYGSGVVADLLQARSEEEGEVYLPIGEDRTHLVMDAAQDEFFKLQFLGLGKDVFPWGMSESKQTFRGTQKFSLKIYINRDESKGGRILLSEEKIELNDGKLHRDTLLMDGEKLNRIVKEYGLDGNAKLQVTLRPEGRGYDGKEITLNLDPYHNEVVSHDIKQDHTTHRRDGKVGCEYTWAAVTTDIVPKSVVKKSVSNHSRDSIPKEDLDGFRIAEEREESNRSSVRSE